MRHSFFQFNAKKQNACNQITLVIKRVHSELLTIRKQTK